MTTVVEREVAPGAALPVVAIEQALAETGAIRLSGTGIASPDAFADVLAGVAPRRMTYDYGSTPRTDLGREVYTSTEYPPRQSIPLHNEMSYTSRWPMRLVFGCLRPARKGGATPLADSRAVLRRLDPALRKRFAERGVKYVRNYNVGVDLTWQQAFRTVVRADVERACRDAGIAFEWLGDDRLRTTEACAATARHPRCGTDVWFNQAHLFHVSSLPPAVREDLLAAVGPDALPRNAYFGDGSEIDDAMLDEIRAAYQAEATDVDWRAGDVVVIDNMLVAHGRRPFTGERRVLVAMCDPASATATA